MVYVWHVDDKEVRRSLSHKSLLGISGEQQVLQANLKMEMLPEMCTYISWAEKVIKVSQEIRVGNYPPLPAPAQTTPDSSGCMIKRAEPAGKLLFAWVLFHLEISQPTLLEEHGNACMEHRAQVPGSSANSDCSHGLWLSCLVCEGW